MLQLSTETPILNPSLFGLPSNKLLDIRPAVAAGLQPPTNAAHKRSVLQSAAPHDQ